MRPELTIDCRGRLGLEVIAGVGSTLSLVGFGRGVRGGKLREGRVKCPVRPFPCR